MADSQNPWWTAEQCTMCSEELTSEPYAEFTAAWGDPVMGTLAELYAVCSQGCMEDLLDQWQSYFCGDGKFDLPARKAKAEKSKEDN